MTSTNQNGNNGFVACEYKEVTAKRDQVHLYTDCYSNFGWTLVDQRQHSYSPVSTSSIASIGTSIASTVAPNVTVDVADHIDDTDIVILKFKRDSRMPNKREINKLESQCESTLSEINKIETKKSAKTMGVSMGIGIVGAGFMVLAGFGFFNANILFGVIFAIVGLVFWGAGFLASRKLGKSQQEKTAPTISDKFEAVYGYCEQAHALLA